MERGLGVRSQPTARSSAAAGYPTSNYAIDVLPLLTYVGAVLIIETSVFTRLLVAVANDEEYREFQVEVMTEPTRWPVIKGVAGARKGRMAIAGRSKRDGARGDLLLGTRG